MESFRLERFARQRGGRRLGVRWAVHRRPGTCPAPRATCGLSGRGSGVCCSLFAAASRAGETLELCL